MVRRTPSYNLHLIKKSNGTIDQAFPYINICYDNPNDHWIVMLYDDIPIINI